MRHFGCAAIAALAVFGFASVACAADMPTKAPVYSPPVTGPYNWTGFYIGGNAGWHQSKDDDPAYISSNNSFIPAAVTTIDQVLPGTLTSNGFAGGLQAGYNWQYSNIVLGVEADIDALSGSSSRNTYAPLCANICAPFSDSARDRWMGTLRARAGFAVDRFLIFATGGAAWSSWSTSHSFTYIGGATISGVDNNTVTRTGWTIGGGLEYALSNNWLARIEYLYANFGTATSTYNVPASAFFYTYITEQEKLSENVVRVGISYKFQ
jgi:outer membrane immunogenic protein